MSGYVLFVDDDIVPTDYYIYALKLRDVDVKYCPDTESARRDMDESTPALAILDVMMPPGVFGDQDTKEGLITGYWIYRCLRAKFPTLQVIMLTNSASATGLFKGQPNVRVISKADCPPRELADAVVAELLKSGR